MALTIPIQLFQDSLYPIFVHVLTGEQQIRCGAFCKKTIKEINTRTLAEVSILNKRLEKFLSNPVFSPEQSQPASRVN